MYETQWIDDILLDDGTGMELYFPATDSGKTFRYRFFIKDSQGKYSALSNYITIHVQ